MNRTGLRRHSVQEMENEIDRRETQHFDYPFADYCPTCGDWRIFIDFDNGCTRSCIGCLRGINKCVCPKAEVRANVVAYVEVKWREAS